jgi:hypothetical protein
MRHSFMSKSASFSNASGDTTIRRERKVLIPSNVPHPHWLKAKLSPLDVRTP